MKVFKFIVFITLFSCTSDLPTVPNFNYDLVTLAKLMDKLDVKSHEIMNGVYTVVKGRKLLGNEVAAKWTKNIFCLYSKHDAVYTEVAGGILDESIMLIGNNRIIRSGASVSLFLKITPGNGCEELLKGIHPTKLQISGLTDDGDEILLQKKKNLKKSQFYTIGHRGGCRNSERINISENSLEMIEYAQVMGCNGVELDVKLTRDNELIIFHDNTFSPRTVTGAYLLGKVQNYTLEDIRLFGRLIHGEKIPTLEEALNEAIDNTDLNLVWMDIKSPEAIDKAIVIQREAINYAKTKNRDVLILLGIPSKEVLRKYDASAYRNTTPILIELDADIAMSYPNCRVWAPRWTNGINNIDVNRIRESGRLAFTWTLDVREYIIDFLESGNYDGILTDYPSLVTSLHFTSQ